MKPNPVLKDIYLTSGGNLLHTHPNYVPYFTCPSGNFIRQCSKTESTFLASVCIRIIPVAQSTHPLYGFSEIPTWHLIASIQVEANYSRYKPETCNNGGDYAFFAWQDWFAAKVNGEWRFMYVDRHTTTAEFGYDELAGLFNTNLGGLEICNASGCHQYATQTNSGQWESEVLEKIGTQGSLAELLSLQYHEETEGEGDGFCRPAVTISKAKEIISILHGLGWKHSPKTRRNARKRGGRR